MNAFLVFVRQTTVSVHMENFAPRSGSKAACMTPTARVLIIAGSDSGGGAGIQADIKTVTMLGGHAMTAVTAITAQNTLGVSAVHPVPAEMILAQIDAVVSDIGVDAVKIGMIGSAFAAEQVARRLEQLQSEQPGLPIVFDPVMVATSGAALADDATIAAFGRLMDVATHRHARTCPNSKRLTSEEDPVAAALHLVGEHRLRGADQGRPRGGRRARRRADRRRQYDQLAGPADRHHEHARHRLHAGERDRLLSRRGRSLADAVARAREFVRVALHDAPELGQGAGPIGHGRVRLDVGARPAAQPGHGDRQELRASRSISTASSASSRSSTARELIMRGSKPRAARPFGPDRSRREDRRDDRHLSRMRRPRRAGRAAGAERASPFEHGPRNQPWMWREARLRDPDGNIIFLYKAGEARRFPPWRMND